MAKRKPKHFPTGSTVRHTSKFLRSIGMVTRRAVDGLVLGTSPDKTRVLVAWSDGHTSQAGVDTLEKTRKQPSYDTRTTVTAERRDAVKKMDQETWTREEIQEIVEYYKRDDIPKLQEVEIREIKQKLKGPFTITSEGEENVYFTDGSGREYFFKHGGSEAARSAFFKAIGAPTIGVGGYDSNPGFTESELTRRLKF